MGRPGGLRGQEGHQAGRSGVCEGVVCCSSWGEEGLTWTDQKEDFVVQTVAWPLSLSINKGFESSR